ncbi:MAG: DUF58 domain-containing protein [Xanthobacteraceae bacterium]|nr:DUF58 domain-containing protein [Xanthobacteraceae bacterium]
MIKPTPRAVAVFAAGIPLTLLLVIYNSALWEFPLAYGLVVLVVMAGDVAAAFPPRRLALRVAAPDSLQIGETSAVIATIARSNVRRPTQFSVLCERRPEVEQGEVVRCNLERGTDAQARFMLAPKRRGRIEIDAMWVRWRGPLGLIEFVRRVPVNTAVDVVPNVRGVRSATLEFFSREALFGSKVQPHKGEGAEFDALRDYAPGLDSRFIDWKRSARHRKLVCKEFRAERNHHVVLAFDTGYLMVEPVDGLPRLDHAINAGLLLAWISLQGGDLVGLYGFDEVLRQYQHPRRGVANFTQLLRATARLDYHHTETNFTLGLAELSARLKRRALVILFTDFVDTITAELLIESMQRLANRHLLVFVTQRGSVLQRAVDAAPERFADVAQAVIAQDFLRERSIVFERLERLGIHCLDVPSSGLAVALINRYLLIKQRGLI